MPLVSFIWTVCIESGGKTSALPHNAEWEIGKSLATALMLAFANDDAEHEKAEEKAHDAFRKLMCLRHGKRVGWKRFCDQIGADPAAIAAPFVENVEWAMQAADAAYEALQEQADQAVDNERTAADIAEAEFEALAEAWEERTENLRRF